MSEIQQHQGFTPVWPPVEVGRKVKKIVIIERSVLDGTLREMWPEISDDHWSFFIYAMLRRADETGEVWVGHRRAVQECAFPLHHYIDPSAKNTDKTVCLYQPFKERELVERLLNGVTGGRSHAKFRVLIAPALLVGDEAPPHVPFTKETRKSLGVPFVQLPADLFRGPWVGLSNGERQCLCAVYAFLTPDGSTGDSNHLRIEQGRLVTSPAFDKASGTHSGMAMTVFASLNAKGLITIAPARLSEVPLYPGSRPPLIASETGPIHAHLIGPVIPVPTKL